MKDFTPEQAAATITVRRLDEHRRNLHKHLERDEAKRDELQQELKDVEATIAGARAVIAALGWIIADTVGESEAPVAEVADDASATE